MKIALVHDYLTQRGGAERVFELLCSYFPQADIFTSVYNPDNTISLGNRQVNTTALQYLPGATRYFRLFAPLYYPMFRTIDLGDYDLVISSTSSFAKAVRTKASATHICFCHNVTRFLWDTPTYLQQYSNYKKYYFLIEKVFSHMRKVDLKYASEPDLYIANSSTVAERIRQYYGRTSVTINYPIDSKNFYFSDSKDDFYLVACRLFGYKKVAVIIEAFNQLQLPLWIIGDGPERKQLEAQANDNIQFLGYVSDRRRRELMAKAKTVVVAALEDYGLVPVEANASGTPVISYGAGGVLDTQIPGKTGVFFKSQTADALIQAILAAEKIQWDGRQIRHHALSNFSELVFFEKVTQVIESVCDRSIADLVEPKLLEQISKINQVNLN
ncbi:MAG TPA: glycosyltransferase [Coleofasciculaceae cyanobacterium]|jgi:glycosyltransferase involved in cell wall biosynthesis